MLIMNRLSSFDLQYFFPSTVGQEVVSKLALESRQAGRDREDIRPDELEDSIADAVYNNKNSECRGSFSSILLMIAAS